MSVVKELIRTEADGGISFGDYELAAKAKKSDFEHRGDLYKVKTFKEITKLERNGLFVYESVPGTTVLDMKIGNNGMVFSVEGTDNTQITVEMEAYTNDKYNSDTERELCRKAVRLIYENLLKVYENGSDIEARQNRRKCKN